MCRPSVNPVGDVNFLRVYVGNYEHQGTGGPAYYVFSDRNFFLLS